MKFKQGMNSNQEFLFPKKPSDFLSDDHLAKAVYEIVDLLSVDKIEAKYSEIGQNAYSPKMMIRILFYGYSVSIRSSRKISNGCEDRFDFLYLTDGLKPSHDRISDFRKENFEELKQLFKEIVLIGANLGLAKFGNIKTSIDGSKFRANASPKLTKDEEGLQKLLDKTEEEINKIFEEAEMIDNEEDEKYGKENRGDELPEHLRSKKSREKAIREAYEKLKQQKEQMKEKIRADKAREPTKAELKKIEAAKINITDHDAKFMKERNGVIKSNYNAQISVDEKEQFIIANDVVDECNDCHQLIPMIKQTKENIKENPKQVKADNGYYSQLEDATRLFPEIDLYVDDKNRRKEDLNMKEIKKEYTDVQFKNLKKLLSKRGCEEYKKRMHTAEPPFGNLKFNFGYRYFLLRGLEKVKGEFNLMCIAHNIKKIVNFITKKKTTIAKALIDIKENIRNTTKIKINDRLNAAC
jgi:transposase